MEGHAQQARWKMAQMKSTRTAIFELRGMGGQSFAWFLPNCVFRVQSVKDRHRLALASWSILWKPADTSGFDLQSVFRVSTESAHGGHDSPMAATGQKSLRPRTESHAGGKFESRLPMIESTSQNGLR